MQNYQKTIQLNNRKARYYDFNSANGNNGKTEKDTTKPILHFYAGNGFPVGVYEPLLEALSKHFNVISLAMQGYWFDAPNDKVLTREQDAKLLIEFLDKTQSKPVIAVGHSQGATATAMSCAERPDLFQSLYLIDPVTFTKAQKIIYSRLPKWLLMTQEPFKSTKVKQADWGSIENYYQTLRRNRGYRRINDENLRIFAKNSLASKSEPKNSDSNIDNKVNNGYTLLFPPKQELASYFGAPYIDNALKALNKKDVPYTLILAKPSVFNSDKVRRSWSKFVPKSNIITLKDYGHLLPLEAPQKCAELIKNREDDRQA